MEEWMNKLMYRLQIHRQKESIPLLVHPEGMLSFLPFGLEIDYQIDRKIDIQIDRQRYRQIDRQIERKYTFISSS